MELTNERIIHLRKTLVEAWENHNESYKVLDGGHSESGDYYILTDSDFQPVLKIAKDYKDAEIVSDYDLYKWHIKGVPIDKIARRPKMTWDKHIDYVIKGTAKHIASPNGYYSSERLMEELGRRIAEFQEEKK